MKINQKYLEIGLIVVILVIGICAYNFGYAPYKEKTDQLQVEINNLNGEKAVLDEKISHTDEYNTTIANADSIIESLLVKYGPGYTMEKAIMMIVDLAEKSGMNVSTITLADRGTLYTSSKVDEEGNPTFRVKGATLSLSFQTGYTAFKNVMDYINNHPERMAADDFNLSYNQENGMLAGSMNISLYGVEDDKHEYVAPVIEDINIGNTNIFKNGEVIVPDEMLEEGAEGNSEAVTE